MKKIINNTLRAIKKNINRVINVFKINSIIFQKSYYPELKRKNIIKRFFDNLFWVLKYSELNGFYNLYGFDVYSKRNKKNYISYYEFRVERNKKNKLDDDYNYVCLLRDKYLFSKYLCANDIKTVKNSAIIRNGIFYDTNFNIIENYKELFNEEKFIKKIDGECAQGVFHTSNITDYENVSSNLKKGLYVVQKKIEQHEKMSKLNAKSVNTIRIVTVRNKDNISVLCSGLRVGTNISGNVDNWAAGGLYVEIDEKGKLKKYGFAKPKYGGKFEVHPDTKIKFEGYEIPYYNDVVNLVTRAHKTFYNIQSIGWDVAITKNGPILIEGNDNWEISLMQVNHGLKNEWRNSLNENS